MSDTLKFVIKDLDRIVVFLAAVLFALYLLSGIYVIEANQMGVVLRFGAKHAVAHPGIGYRLPWPVDSLKKVNVKEVQKIEVGFFPDFSLNEELLPYCITGDRNIIHNSYAIQYRIEDPGNYLIAGKRIQEILYELGQAVILEEVASRYVDPLLTTDKPAIELAVRNKMVEKLAALNIKIQIVGVERKNATPPNLVKDAFQDVITAQEEKRTKVHEADNYRNRRVPKAEGEASKMIKKAEAAKFKRTSSAKGEAQRFLKMYDEYKRAPELTRTRLYLEMVEQVLPKTTILVLATDKNGKPVKVKLIQAPIPTTPRLPSQ